MRKTLKAALILLAVCASQAQNRPVNVSQAKNGAFGLGIIVGEPTGISAKYWTSGSNSLAFAVGWYNQYIPRPGNDFRGTRFHMHADYLWHSFDAIRSAERFPLFYGTGMRLESGGADPATFGVRGVVGVAWWPRSTPLDVFLEVAPVLQLAPFTSLGMGAALGMRVFF